MTNFDSPKIKGKLDLGRFELTNFDPPPQIKGKLDLGRFELTNFDTLPNKGKIRSRQI